MKKKLVENLPEDVVNVYETLKGLRRAHPERHYAILNDADFTKIADPLEAHRVYWHDTLKRVHIVVMVSSLKTLRWMEAIDNNSENFYGFCSALRGLIESVADTFYTLYKVPLTIASDFRTIKNQIDKTSRILTDHPRLEETLLHYLQATKLSKAEKEKFPKFLNTEPVSQYIASIDDDSKGLYSLYSTLCSIAHPSYESNCVFMTLHEGGSIVFSDSSRFESDLIATLLKEHSLTLRDLFRRYCNILLSTMLVLNEFGIGNLAFVMSDAEGFKSGIVWQEFQSALVESEKRYLDEIRRGQYV